MTQIIGIAGTGRMGTAFAKRLPIDRQGQVDGKFHPRRSPDRPQMFDPAAKLLQNGFCPVEGGFGPSCHA